MSAVEWVVADGFRSLRSDEPIRLNPINVIIGSNGSGKSNFIGVFSFLHAIRLGHLKQYTEVAGGANAILHFGARQTKELILKIAFENEKNSYEIKLVPTADDLFAVADEYASFWNKTYPKPYTEYLVSMAGEAGISRSHKDPIISYVQKHLDRWRLYHFHDTSRSSPLKQTCDLEDNEFLRGNGANAAAFLFMLRQTDPAVYQLIRSTIQSVAPFFDDFLLEPSRLNPNKIRLNWKHVGTDEFFGPDALSDGTLRFIALAILFLQPTIFRPSLILVDEPELGLHPYALTVLASMIKSASVTTQVVVSTQSSQLLDNFEPSDVLVADRVNNATVFNRLDALELESWLHDYSLGELWEKGELGGRPRSSGRL